MLNDGITAVLLVHRDRNRELLEKAIASIFSQTIPCKKVVCVDRETEPQLVQFLNEYQWDEMWNAPFTEEQDPWGDNKFAWIWAHIQTKYFAPLHDDDQWLPVKLEEQMKVKAKIVSCWAIRYLNGNFMNQGPTQVPSSWLINMEECPNNYEDHGTIKNKDYRFFERNSGVMLGFPLFIYNFHNKSMSTKLHAQEKAEGKDVK